MSATAMPIDMVSERQPHRGAYCYHEANKEKAEALTQVRRLNAGSAIWTKAERRTAFKRSLRRLHGGRRSRSSARHRTGRKRLSTEALCGWSDQKSLAAFANLKKICEDHLAGRYKIEVLDLLEKPQLARGDRIQAIPTLVRHLPPPTKKIIGDLSDTEKVLVGLDLLPPKVERSNDVAIFSGLVRKLENSFLPTAEHDSESAHN